MNDDDLRAALARRVSTSLSADERNDILRAARIQATKPQRQPLWPRLAGLVAATAAVLVLVIVVLPILISPPRPAAPSTSPVAQRTTAPSNVPASATPSNQSEPPSAGLPIYSAQELSDMIGDPAWVGQAILAHISDGQMTSTRCPLPTSGLAHCPLNLNIGAGYRIDVGLRDATSTDGVQYDDGSGYRWVLPLSVPEHGDFAFSVGGDSAEYLGEVALSVTGKPLHIDDLLGMNSEPGERVFAIDGWLLHTIEAPCAFPQEGLASPMPDISSYYCGGSWIAPTKNSVSSGLSVDGGLHVQNGAYEEFAPNPQPLTGGGTVPRQGVYLIRTAGCPEVVTGDCPVWRGLGRLDNEAIEPSPEPSSTPNPATLTVNNQSTLTLNVLINGQPAATAQPQAMSFVDPGQYAEPWQVTVTTMSGRQLLELTYRASDVSYGTGSATGVGQRADLSCGRIDIYAGPPLLGPGSPSTFAPGDCDDSSPQPSSPTGYATADLGDISFEYPSGWTLNPINEVQHYGAILAFVSSEKASATATCAPDYQPGLGGHCDHSYDLPDGSMIVRVERYALPGHGMQSVAYEVGSGWQAVEVNGMSGAYSNGYTDVVVPNRGQSVAWEFAAPADAIANYTIVASDTGYPDSATVLAHLISTVAVNSPYTDGGPIDQFTVEDIAKSFFAGAHENKTIGDMKLTSTLGTDDASGRSAWQVDINAPITEPSGVTYTSAFKLSIDAVNGAVRVVAQG